MKKHLNLILLGLFFSLLTIAQETDNKKMSVEQAKAIIIKSYDQSLKAKATETLYTYANVGNAQAMHILGMMHYQGIGLKTDYDIAYDWFLKSAELGYARAYYNLAMMYRRGVGVKQDFEKAFHYITESDKCGFFLAKYAKGYFYYKGLGCEQNYEEAIKSFKEGTELQEAGSMHLLGVCYRNGYGVERDEAQANYWISKAARIGVGSAKNELRLETAERPVNLKRLRNNASDSNEAIEEEIQFKATEHTLDRSTSLTGNYSGIIITYDWSGKYILSESKLEVDIEEDGNNIIFKWQEENATDLEATAVLTDSTLVFTDASYARKDHYNPNYRKWDLTSLNLSPRIEEGRVVLEGNLQLYSKVAKEPNKPMYLILKSNQINQDNTSSLQESELDFWIYPNPFVKNLNLSIDLKENFQNCIIDIYSTSGNQVYQQHLGALNQGKHYYQIDLNAPSGTYILNLTLDGTIHSTKVIKK